MSDASTEEQAAILRGLLYLACEDAPTAALESTAAAIAERAADRTQPAQEAVVEAQQLADPRPPNDRPRDLRAAVLGGADLTDATLAYADLIDADLTRANLTDATLNSADLTHARLIGADLTRATLTDAWLSHARLNHARLNHSDLTDANLTQASLMNADLTGTNLTHANLTGTNLTGARGLGALPGAVWDQSTAWPSPEAAERVAMLSDEVRPGVFRVRGGDAPDRHRIGVPV